MPRDFTPGERLEILRAGDKLRTWSSLDDERICMLCQRILNGWQIEICVINVDATCLSVQLLAVLHLRRIGVMSATPRQSTRLRMLTAKGGRILRKIRQC